MGFLFPEFLFCLALIAIPVIIHLFNFRRFKKVYFTNVNFLKDLQVQTAAVQSIKERLILLCRILAVFFLVLAFAQPFIKGDAAEQRFQKNVISIYLDNSFSMQALNKDGTLLEEAKRKAKDLVQAYGLNDRFQLLTNNFDGTAQRLLTKDEFLDEIENLKVSPLTISYQQVVAQQQAFLLGQNQVNRSAYLISDFQKQANSKQIVQKDSTVNFSLIPLVANSLPNISIDSVYFLNPFHQAGQSESLVYKLSNHSNKAVDDVALTLKVNGVQKAIGNSSIKAYSTVVDTLRFSGLKGVWQKASLTIKDYPIAFDDELNFAFEIQNTVNITAIYDGSPVKPFSAAYRTDPFFKFTEIDQAQINYSTLASEQMLLLQNLQTIPIGLAQQLKQYVNNGGSLSVFIPLKADLSSYQTFLKTLETDVPTSLEAGENKVNKINLAHPLFKGVFDGQPKNIDLPVAKSYFKTSDFTRTSKQVLFSGTASNNLLSAYQLGKGKVYISFLPLELEASNFAQHALFLPILFKTALLGFNPGTLFYTLGNVKSVVAPAVQISESETVRVKGNGVDIIADYQNKASNSSIFFADQLKQAGFYDVIFNDSLLSVFALNLDREESAQAFYSQNELEEKFGLSAKSLINAKEKITSQQIKEVNLGTPLWKLCLILTLIFLAAEVLLIRFYKKPSIIEKYKTAK